MLPAFEVFEHTADIGLTAYGKTLPELFQNAAVGMFSFLVPLSEVGLALREAVRLERAPDPEELLARWLNDLLALAMVEHMIFRQFKVTELQDASTGWSLRAEALGELWDPHRHQFLREIKAATRHDLKIVQDSSGFHARIVFDV